MGKSEKKEQSSQETQLGQDVLKAMHQEVQAHIEDHEKPEGKEPSKPNRPNINYHNNPVRVSDALGVIFLGILSALLLWALLRAHKREREWLGQQ